MSHYFQRPSVALWATGERSSLIFSAEPSSPSRQEEGCLHSARIGLDSAWSKCQDEISSEAPNAWHGRNLIFQTVPNLRVVNRVQEFAGMVSALSTAASRSADLRAMPSGAKGESDDLESEKHKSRRFRARTTRRHVARRAGSSRGPTSERKNRMGRRCNRQESRRKRQGCQRPYNARARPALNSAK